MGYAGTFLKLASLLALSWLALVGSPGSAPNAALEARPGRPAAGAPMRFLDASAGNPTAWEWSFGDGVLSTERNPQHTFAGPGSYLVTLRVTNSMGQSQTTSALSVSDADTLTLLSGIGNGFDVTLQATDPRTGNTGTGQAIPQNDVFGYFTVPALVPTSPGSPLVPEVFVKMLDARAIGQDFWVFWGGLTDLTYTLTVTDTVRGTVKVFHNPVTGNAVCLGADTSGFATVSTPTPTVTGPAPTPTPTPPVTGQKQIVEIHDDLFRDTSNGTSTTTIHVGDTVQWQWKNTHHSTTSGPCPPCTGDGIWNSGIQDVQDATFEHTFTQSGSFPYFCMVHLTDMTGTVIVNP